MPSEPSRSHPARTVVAHRHRLIRSGLAALLGGMDELEVVAEVRTCRELASILEPHGADLLVLDAGSVQGQEGGALMASLASCSPGLKWLVLGMQDSPAALVREAVCRGASGYLREDASEAEFFAAVRAVVRGGSYFGAEVASAAIGMDAKNQDHLTDRQEEVLKLLASGMSPDGIARQLGLSPKTVSAHRSRISARLGMNDIPGLTRYALRTGLASL